MRRKLRLARFENAMLKWRISYEKRFGKPSESEVKWKQKQLMEQGLK